MMILARLHRPKYHLLMAHQAGARRRGWREASSCLPIVLSELYAFL